MASATQWLTRVECCLPTRQGSLARMMTLGRLVDVWRQMITPLVMMCRPFSYQPTSSSTSRRSEYECSPLSFTETKWMDSVLWHCWLGGRKGIRPVKTEWRGAGMVICLERGADLHMAQLMPLPLTVSCFSKIQIGLPSWYRLTRVVLEKGPLNGCVCVCVWDQSLKL